MMIEKLFVPICLVIIFTVAAFVFYLNHPIDPNSVEDDSEHD